MTFVPKRLRAMGRVAFTAALVVFWYGVGRFFWRPRVVFQVYGTERDRRAYFTPWMERVLPPSFPIALLRVEGGWGLVAGTAISDEQLDADPALSGVIVGSALQQYRTRALALAGRLPSWMRRSGLPLEAPAVSGSFGTRYAMGLCARALSSLGEKPASGMTMGIIGAGFTGRRVAEDLAREFAGVVAFDTRFTDCAEVEDNVAAVGDPEALREVGAAIVFTPRGDDVAPYASYLSPGALIADDTHPCMKRPTRVALERRGVRLFKAVTEAREPIRISPRLPNFSPTSVPGCLLEAIVVAQQGEACLTTFQNFCEAAAQSGFRPVLMPHPDDS